ncbi:MAG: oxidoreductase, partial [Cryobacterium sp.]|nr:oxidoreductase [Cryobacterium sp.]
EGRGGSVIVHEQLAVGDVVHAALPRNNFLAADAAPWVSGAAAPVVFVAGGIGITPILPMLRAAQGSRIDWQLLYLGRRLETMAFRDELAEFGDRVRLHPRDANGSLALADALGELCRADTVIFACGPQRLLDAVEGWCADSQARLHVEKFTPVEAVREGDTAFEVELGDGTLVDVGADESILTALTRCGIPALNSCQEGNCGTCETFVLEGVPEHRDNVLSEEERAAGESMMICVSRARTPRLVLDL